MKLPSLEARNATLIQLTGISSLYLHVAELFGPLYLTNRSKTIMSVNFYVYILTTKEQAFSMHHFGC